MYARARGIVIVAEREIGSSKSHAGESRVKKLDESPRRKIRVRRAFRGCLVKQPSRAPRAPAAMGTVLRRGQLSGTHLRVQRATKAVGCGLFRENKDVER